MVLVLVVLNVSHTQALAMRFETQLQREEVSRRSAICNRLLKSYARSGVPAPLIVWFSYTLNRSMANFINVNFISSRMARLRSVS